LSNQDPRKKYLVLWNGRGANAVSHVHLRNNLPTFTVDQVKIKPKNFVIDITCGYIATNNLDEAHYLCAMINSNITNRKVKPFQPRGQYGHRDIGRRQFQLSIPKFDSSDVDHKKLVSLSKECHDIVQKHSFKTDTFKAMRNEVLKLLKGKYKEIDKIVSKIL